MESNLPAMTDNPTLHTPSTTPDTSPSTSPDTSSHTTLDTTIREPSMTASEIEIVLFAIDRSRAQFAWKCGGLDAAGLRHTHPPTTMTLGGLLKHLTLVEEKFAAMVGPNPVNPWDDHDEDWEWRTAADDSPEDLYKGWHDAMTRCRTALTEALTDAPDSDAPDSDALDSDSPDGDGLDRQIVWGSARPNLRRMLMDMHDEYARHVGHADLLREAVDGLVGEDPPQS